MRPIVEAYARHEGSKKAFCQEYGIAPHTLDYWRGKFEKQKTESSGFIALEVNDGFSNQSIEVHYPNGIRAIVPMETPASVLQSLLSISA